MDPIGSLYFTSDSESAKTTGSWPGRSHSTIHVTSTTPAASASSSTSRGASRTASSTRGCRSCATCSTAAPAAARRTRATARACSSRCPTASCERRQPTSGSRCRPPASTAPGSSSCPRIELNAIGSARSSSRRSRRKDTPSSAGARSRATMPVSARRRAPPSRSSNRCSSRIAGAQTVTRTTAARTRFERSLFVIRKQVEHAADRAAASPTPAPSTSSACRRTRSSTRAC